MTTEIGRAVTYLESRGFKILDREWNHADGTIPVIGSDRHRSVIIIFDVRVRHRANVLQVPPLSMASLRRLRRLAVHWMDAHGMHADRVRVDRVVIIHDGPGGFTIKHIEGVG